MGHLTRRHVVFLYALESILFTLWPYVLIFSPGGEKKECGPDTVGSILGERGADSSLIASNGTFDAPTCRLPVRT